VNDEAERRGAFRVSGHQLIVVSVEREVEGVGGVRIDNEQVRVDHRQLAKPQGAVAKVHVVRRTSGGFAQRPDVLTRRRAEALHDLAIAYRNPGQSTADSRRGEDGEGIEDEVIAVDAGTAPALRTRDG